MRLQKYIAHSGIASRRAAEKLISEGKVTVNGNIISEMGYIVQEGDEVCVNNEKIHIEEKKVYVILNKPKGYITSVKDQFGRKTVLDLVKSIDARIFPVGRLDYHTSGLLLLTNDGDLTNKMTHPSHEIKKTYVAKINGVLTLEAIKKLREGVVIEEGFTTSPCNVNVLKKENSYSLVEITIHEGKNRQVRKMFEAVGYKVTELTRTKEGTLTLSGLKPGEWRYLTESELIEIKKIL